ncbi:hypothetical protein ACF1BP_29325 [Streptomyces sp. NPDC014735]|uniref:hypothetical protein n=1 Tax=unclassified Streptomyces TaxID=2593676 RepID=UPI0036FDDB17
MLDGIVHAAQTDRYARFTALYGKFYNPDVNLGERISQEVVKDALPAAEIRRDRRRTARTAVDARDEVGHALLGFIKH